MKQIKRIIGFSVMVLALGTGIYMIVRGTEAVSTSWVMALLVISIVTNQVPIKEK